MKDDSAGFYVIIKSLSTGRSRIKGPYTQMALARRDLGPHDFAGNTIKIVYRLKKPLPVTGS